MYTHVPGGAIAPEIYPVRPGEMAHDPGYGLTTVPNRCLVRLTGGCGNLPEAQAPEMYKLFVDSFSGFAGALIIGGSRMIRLHDGIPDRNDVRPGVTEVAPMIKRLNPSCQIMGIVPIEHPPIKLDLRVGAIISEEPDKGFITIVHPCQDYCLMLQASPDDGVIWEAEYKYCLRFGGVMINRAKFSSLTLAYQGGGTTEKEIRDTAALGRPVLLIDGSGGKTEMLARDRDFLDHHPNVRVSDHTVDSLRQELFRAQALMA